MDPDDDPRAGGLKLVHLALAVAAVLGVIALIVFWPGRKPQTTQFRQPAPIVLPSKPAQQPAVPNAQPPVPPKKASPGQSGTLLSGGTHPSNGLPPPVPAPVHRKPSPLGPKAPIESERTTVSQTVKRPRASPTSQTSQTPPMGGGPQIAKTAQTPPPPIPERPLPVPAPPTLSDDFAIDILSRSNPIENGSSFPVDDQILGELALGDIKVMVEHRGQRLSTGRMTLEWVLDGIPLGRKPVQLGQLVEYAAEPTVGTYKVVLRLGEKVIQNFTFRITPAK